MFNFSAILKYVLEGLAVALAAFFIPQRKVDVKEIVLIALTAAAVFSILDQFSPLTGSSARQGAGFGIGLNQVGWGRLQNNYYGGQDPRLSCTCEVDADYLRSQICTENSSSNSTNVGNNAGKNVSASKGTNTGKNVSTAPGKNVGTSTGNTTGNNAAANTGITTGNNMGASTGSTTGNNVGASTGSTTGNNVGSSTGSTNGNNVAIPGKQTANAAQSATIATFEPASVDIINKSGRKTTFQVKEHIVNSAANGTVEPFDGFTQIW